MRLPRVSTAAKVAAWIISIALLLLYLFGPPQPPAPDRPFSVTSTTLGVSRP